MIVDCFRYFPVYLNRINYHADVSWFSELWGFSTKFDPARNINILRISPYSVRMRETADQNNSEYRHFLWNEYLKNENELQKVGNSDISNCSCFLFLNNKTKQYNVNVFYLES